jgi:hypothetical protein
MRRFLVAATAIGAMCFCGGLSEAQAHGHGMSGFGMYPFGVYPMMMPGASPYGGSSRSLSSLYRKNTARQTMTPVVQKTGDDKPILIFCPEGAAAALNYRLNDRDYVINPGESRLLTNDRTWVVSFDRGGEHGTAKYTTSPGTYSFGLTADHGWELYHDADMSRFKTSGGVLKNALPSK